MPSGAGFVHAGAAGGRAAGSASGNEEGSKKERGKAAPSDESKKAAGVPPFLLAGRAGACRRAARALAALRTKMAAGVATSGHYVVPSCPAARLRSPARALAGAAGAATAVAPSFRHFRNGWRGGSAEPSRHPCRTFLRRLSVQRQGADLPRGLLAQAACPSLAWGQPCMRDSTHLRACLAPGLALQPAGCHQSRVPDPAGEPADPGHLAWLSALNRPIIPLLCVLICIRTVFQRADCPVRHVARAKSPLVEWISHAVTP